MLVVYYIIMSYFFIAITIKIVCIRARVCVCLSIKNEGSSSKAFSLIGNLSW